MGEAQQEKPADAWGQPISEERKAELQGYLDRWAADWAAKKDPGERSGAFYHVNLTGADVAWLADRSGRQWSLEVPMLQLQGAFLYHAHLEKALLSLAHLEGVFLSDAHLEGANLTSAWLDSRTVLTGATLDDKTRLADIQWSGVGAVNLTRLNWSAVRTLGDEQNTPLRAPADQHETVVRAYRQLAAQLRAQGMSEVADRFIYRAQVCQRRVVLRRGRIPQWLGSWFLAALAGYGYRPGRTLFWYLVTIAGFAFAYLSATTGWIPFGLPHPSAFAPLTWYEALILSVSSFHGRGFFQPVQSLGDPIAALAAIEAVIGLVIEVSFIATFTQRFFNSR